MFKLFSIQLSIIAEVGCGDLNCLQSIVDLLSISFFEEVRLFQRILHALQVAVISSWARILPKRYYRPGYITLPSFSLLSMLLLYRLVCYSSGILHAGGGSDPGGRVTQKRPITVIAAVEAADTRELTTRHHSATAS